MEEKVIFAKTNFRNQQKAFGIKTPDRRQHMYIIGKSGTGKTTLLENLAIQDIISGKGICIIDPHGEFVENIVSRIPDNRIKDTVYFNAADAEFPIGFNVLEIPDPKYKHLVVSDLLGIFTKIWSGVWSARMEYILSNCALALLDTPETTLMGIIRILTDKDYRQKIIANVKDPVVKAFWIHEYEAWRDQFRNEAIVPIQNKVGQFLSTSLIRNIVGQAKSSINIGRLMDEQKILLINVSKGKIGEENSALLGAMFVTKIQLAAMERIRIEDPAARKDFYLYVDEFQNFATESFATILSEARKFRLNLIMAHQYIGQLTPNKEHLTLRDAIFGNVGTMISFRVGAADAEFLEKEFEPEFNLQDIINLPNYHVYLKLMVDGISSRPFSATALPPFALSSSPVNKEKVIENSRAAYGRPKKKVEEEINRWSGLGSEPSYHQPAGRERKFEKRPEEEARPRRERPRTMKYADTLGEMGIEFEYRRTSQPLVETEKTYEEKPADEKEKFMTLDELSKAPQKETRKKEFEKQKAPGIDELKMAIKKALEEQTAE